MVLGRKPVSELLKYTEQDFLIPKFSAREGAEAGAMGIEISILNLIQV